MSVQAVLGCSLLLVATIMETCVIPRNAGIATFLGRLNSLAPLTPQHPEEPPVDVPIDNAQPPDLVRLATPMPSQVQDDTAALPIG